MTMKHSLIALAAMMSISAHAVDAFDSGNNVLSLETVQVGGTLYRNVAVQITGYSLLGVDGGSAQQTTFDTSTNVLRLGAVALNGTTYTNVRVQVTGYNIISGGIAATAGNLGGISYSGTEQAGYAQTLNAARTACGIPALSQNTVLDTASVVTGTGAVVFGNKQFVAGDNVTTARTAGYALPDSVGNVHSAFVTQTSVNNPTDLTERTNTGKYVAQVAMTDPYALLTLMRPYTEIGTNYTFSLYTVRDIKAAFGNAQATRTLSHQVVTYPCANTTDAVPAYTRYGSSGVSYVATLPGSTVADEHTAYVNSFAGAPIAVYANANESLVLTGASVTPQGGTAVGVELRDSTKIGNKFMAANEGLIVPLTSMQPNTAYDVVIYGTANGVAFNKNFTFRTGATIPQNPV